ncbi:LuxR family transcriptional regulator [Streptomyces seoulensis]|uniref:LuxR family transcriptional regulator n=1 Tax=Streptomyces seoulensis TaxID=73044 RepID=A0A4P6U192_STRSO|nr:LuxR family transcriptional regulator [Streptomyces seoulensis]
MRTDRPGLPAQSGPALSARECEVLTHLADGLTHASIARRMRLSPHTVDTYLRRIRGKTGSPNRVQLLRLAIAVSEARDKKAAATGG